MTSVEVLTPVRKSYGSWLGASDEQVDVARQEDPDQVRALQLVLRMERETTPSRRRALELAATACALMCLDKRSAPEGEWHGAVDAYCRGRIRKVTRRARGAQWEATADLPGLTLTDGDTQVRALVPGLVTELDKRVAKLQVGGTDLPEDAVPRDAPCDEGDAPVLACRVPESLGMTAGKLMAQTGHAGMIAAAVAASAGPELLDRWHGAGCPVRADVVDDDTWRDLVATMADPAHAWIENHRIAVRDAGYTEVDPGTITVIADLR